MSTSLPSENCLDKTVETFGLGAYDYPQSGLEHGEDSNRRMTKQTLPDDGGSDSLGPEKLLSYPLTVSVSMTPGEIDRPPSQKTPPSSHLDSVVHSVSNTELPDDHNNPSAHSDYYDRMTTSESVDDIWSDRGDEVYASEEEFDYDVDSLPGLPTNEKSTDNNTQSLGNYWSGYITQDLSNPAGFPSTEFEDPQRWQQTNASGHKMKKISTNLELVRGLSSQFLKKFGKVGLTRRHVMAYLHNEGSHQFLTSDIVRCLKEDHGVVIKDVLDEFAVHAASKKINLSSIRDRLIDLEIQSITKPNVSAVFRYAAADLSRTIALLDQLGVENG